MATISSFWIKITDANGSEALQVFELELKNAVPPITVDYVSFFEKGDDGISRSLETKLSNAH